MKIKTLLALLAATTTITLVSCKGKDDAKSSSEQPHVHARDEFGICECGDIEEKSGIKWAQVGAEEHSADNTAGRVELYKIAGMPHHKFIFSQQRYFNIKLVEWVENGKVEKVENPTLSTEFEPSVALTYYVKAEVEADNDGNCYFKYAWAETPEHAPNEYGLCGCRTFVGKQASTSSDGSAKNSLAYLSTYNAYGDGIDWYFWTVTNDKTSMYIGGDNIATRHTVGLWYSDDGEVFNKISDSGYNITFTRDNADENKKLKNGIYILKVSKSSMGIQETAALKVKLYTA